MFVAPIPFAAALALAAMAGSVSAQPAPVSLPLDVATSVQGVEVACTGVGDTRADPQWAAYPVRIEFSNARNEYMTDADVTVKDAKGRIVVQAGCASPWLLMKLSPGAYTVSARLADSPAKPRSAPFKAPAKGQLRVVLQFPDA